MHDLHDANSCQRLFTGGGVQENLYTLDQAQGLTTPYLSNQGCSKSGHGQSASKNLTPTCEGRRSRVDLLCAFVGPGLALHRATGKRQIGSHVTIVFAKLHPCKLAEHENGVSPSSRVNVSMHLTNLVLGLVLGEKCLGDDTTGMMPRAHDTVG